MSAGKMVIVKRKKKTAHAHHGGSWKVAYADFVTAMMAFFMVMWIMGMEQEVRDLVQGYFENPVGFKRGFSGGRNILSQGNSIMSTELRRTMIVRRLKEEARLRDVAEAIEVEITRQGLVRGLAAAVEVVVTDAGLRIEMMETGRGSTFFDKSSAQLSETLREVLALVAHQIALLPNGVVVEGHTDSLTFGGAAYSNWELSVDRANAARRALVDTGLPPDHVIEVRGYAERQPKISDNPLDDRNRRITILLPFDTPTVEDLSEEELSRADLIEALDLIPSGARR